MRHVYFALALILYVSLGVILVFGVTLLVAVLLGEWFGIYFYEPDRFILPIVIWSVTGGALLEACFWNRFNRFLDQRLYGQD